MTNSGNKFIQQLTRDTGCALSLVCRGLVNLTRYLLVICMFECGNLYVMLGWLATDSLGKAFRSLWQGPWWSLFYLCTVSN